METPMAMRILKPLNLNRQIFTKPYTLSLTLKLLHHPQQPRNLTFTPLSLSSKTLNQSPTFSTPNFPKLGFPLSLSSSSTQFTPNSPPHGPINNLKFEPNNGTLFHLHKSSNPNSCPEVSSNGKREFAAVILGWLGAKPKHLKRYAELYTSRGIDAITFVVPVKDVLWFDLGKKVEFRIRELANELVSWLSNDEGRKRCLIFHTFSNTGWLVYGAILGHLQERPDLIERIRGCIVDSGGDPELNPKVWAAGFTAALVKKRNSIVSPLAEATEQDRARESTNLQDEDPFKIEAAIFLLLEKIFSFLLKLPDVNQRLSKIISLLSESQPPFPQLYLYSTADRVIPYRAVEDFFQHQKAKGRTVSSFNFGTSPHVDHYRTYPDVYSAQVNSFLNEILVIGKQS